MFELTIQAEFEAAHNLCNYQGKCHRLHGHNWKVEVTVRGFELDELGMVIDFTVLKAEVKTIIDRLDHYYLNELPAFETKNPTAENIAKYIYDELVTPLEAKQVQIYEVKVWESPRSAVAYRQERNHG
ncbi:MAG: 6-carboxytetrahydropterin synthase QueD [Sporomusaceae bacterium]|nr:6-carboxytetrahydropterin synthase QueD [Sporomusaceae bacterium]